MTTIYHPASGRGHINFGWLDSHHSFSFGNWYDGQKVQFGALRVLNDDVVKGGGGFDTHKHENMEIISIPLKGALAHKDSTGSEGILYTGDVQIMSSGSGISHSEFNASPDEPEARRPKARHNAGQAGGVFWIQTRPLDPYDPVNFLQLWIFPRQTGGRPRHEQRSFDPTARVGQWQIVVSPRPEDEALRINQDARLALARLGPGALLEYRPAFAGNGVYIFVIEGGVEAGGQSLERRDGLGLAGTEVVPVRASSVAEVLAIEVPMFA